MKGSLITNACPRVEYIGLHVYGGGGVLNRQFSFQRAPPALALPAAPTADVGQEVPQQTLALPAPPQQASPTLPTADVGQVSLLDAPPQGDVAVDQPVAGKKAGKKSVAEATACIVQALACSAKAKGKGKAKAKAKSKAALKLGAATPLSVPDTGAPKAKASVKKKAVKVELNHERSRSQYLCRSGVPEVPSKTFKYGSGATQKAALQQAKEWCRKTCKQLKVEPSQRFLD